MSVWAVVPVKRFEWAKQRMAPALSPGVRRALARAMFLDVLDAVMGAPGLAGVAVVTEDAAAGALARGAGCRVMTEGAGEGHTAAVMGAARLLRSEGCGGMLTVPGDVPLVTAREIGVLLEGHGAGVFTIAPSHDEMGSNGVLMAPPDAMGLRFGDDSFRPHCRAAETCGLVVRVVRLAGLACDLDTPEDLARFMGVPSTTRARAVLSEHCGG